MNAEELARSKFPEGIFETLPDIVKEQLIDNQQKILMYEAKEQRREEERREKQEYEEMQARALERSRQLLRESGIADRVGRESKPFRLNRVEQGHVDLSSSFLSIEPSPLVLIGGVIHGFQRSTIEHYVPQMQALLDEARSHKDVQRSATAYIMFHLWTSGKCRSGTRAIGISHTVSDVIDDLFLALDKLIKDIERVKGAYSDIYETTDNYIHLYFKASYYPEPKSVTNWGNDIKEIEQRKHFNIFTANNVNLPCAVQVAQRLWPGSDISTLEDIIAKASPKICIVKPHSSVSNLNFVQEYSDLVIEAISPIKSLTVIDPDIIYLLHYDEHIGILEDLKPHQRVKHYTSFRPLQKYPNAKKITLCFDIECYFDADNDQTHIPYLCCACFIYDDQPGNVVEFSGKDCIAQMLDYAVDTVTEFKLKYIELIAHNGGGYDFHYLLTSIGNPTIIKNILMRNNRFISFRFKYCNITFNVKDSLNFMLCSLSNAAKSFLDESDRKTHFPHHELRSETDLAKVFNEWLDIEQIINVNTEKEKMIVTNEHVINYANNDNAKTLLDWSKQYCVNDVIVLAKVWIKFKQTVADIFNCEIVDQTYTLAGMSFRLFEAHLPVYLDTHTGDGKICLYHPAKIDYFNMRKSLIGGRCISVNGIYKDVLCLDVKSLYPAAMAYYEQPYGRYRKVTEEIDTELGIYYCEVQPAHIDGHGFFPLRANDGVKYDSQKGIAVPLNETYCAWYTSIDMQIGRQEGHTIKVISFEDKYVGYSWKHKGLVFKEYIENVLYKLKLKYEQVHDHEKRWVVKIIMNSLWGKFAQKWMEDSYYIKSEEQCDMVNDECNKLFDTEYFMVKSIKAKHLGGKPIQNGVFTLSYARYHMYQLWHKIVQPGTVCLYSDTDSMMIPRNSLIKDAKIRIDGKYLSAIGDGMGQLEIEYEFDEFICVGKKQYIGKYGNKYKKRFKGVPQQYITPDLYRHLLKSPDNVAQIRFLKFKREWGCVHGYMESKNVSQT